MFWWQRKVKRIPEDSFQYSMLSDKTPQKRCDVPEIREIQPSRMQTLFNNITW